MTCFILEIRKNGDEYPPNTLHHLVCGIIRFLRQSGQPQLHFFKDVYTGFHSSLDGEMKRLQSKGIGTASRQVELLTVEEEEQRKVLGDHNPYTVFFMIGFYFALPSGDEHRQLWSNPCQIRLREKSGEASSVVYGRHIEESPRRIKRTEVQTKGGHSLCQL